MTISAIQERENIKSDYVNLYAVFEYEEGGDNLNPIEKVISVDAAAAIEEVADLCGIEIMEWSTPERLAPLLAAKIDDGHLIALRLDYSTGQLKRPWHMQWMQNFIKGENKAGLNDLMASNERPTQFAAIVAEIVKETRLGQMYIAQIASKLAEYAEYSGHKLNTLEQRVRRLFEKSAKVRVKDGILEMVISTAPNTFRARRSIVYIPDNSAAGEIADYL